MRRRYPLLLMFVVGLAPSLAGGVVPPHPDLRARLRAEGTYPEVLGRLAVQAESPEGAPTVPRKAPGDVVNWHAIVILVDFDDQPATGLYGRSDFEAMLLSNGTWPTGSMRDYYDEASYGDFQLTGDVVGWYRMPRDYSFYCNNDGLPETDDDFGWGTYPFNARKLYEDAVAAADPDVDYNDYLNGNSRVQGVFVVHAGPGAETTGNPSDIWSHFTFASVATDDGVVCRSYSHQPELQAAGMSTMGVFAHEFGHALGIPDLYDTDGSSRGIGRWCLMAGGSWNDEGRTPAHFSAWCKRELGWVQPDALTVDTQGRIIRPTTRARDIVLLHSDSHADDEFLLVETRAREGFDRELPGPGLLVWHVDDRQQTNQAEVCETPADDRPIVRLLQADGLCQLEADLFSDPGDAFGLFPGLDTLDAESMPNTRAYDGRTTGLALRDIRLRGDDSHLDIFVNESVALGVPGAFASLDAALQAASERDEIRLRHDHEESGPFAISRRTRITGGWDGGYTIQHVDRPTLIRGPADGSTTFAATDGGTTLELDNLVLSGTAGPTGAESVVGGAIHMVDGTLLVSRVEFRDHQPAAAASRGGALAVEGSTVGLTDCRFVSNRAEAGGAIWADNSILTLDGVRLEGNSATGNGGGLSATRSWIDLRRSRIERNSAANGAIHLLNPRAGSRVRSSVVCGNDAGLVVQNGSLLVEQSTFFGNGKASVQADGVSLQLGGNLFVETAGPAVRVASGTVQRLDYNGWWRVAGELTAGVRRGDHAIIGNPRFLDPAGGDFRLGAGSYAIDAGDPTQPADFDGSRPDLGAHGGADDAGERPAGPLQAAWTSSTREVTWRFPTEGRPAAQTRVFGRRLGSPSKGEQRIIDHELAAVDAPTEVWAHPGARGESYRVQLVAADGAAGSYSEILNPPAGGVPPPPAFQLGQPFPNPFNPTTELELCLGVTTRVCVEIFSLSGRRVTTLLDEALPPGINILRWTGVDDHDVRVASGAYLMRVTTPTDQADRRLILLK